MLVSTMLLLIVALLGSWVALGAASTAELQHDGKARVYRSVIGDEDRHIFIYPTQRRTVTVFKELTQKVERIDIYKADIDLRPVDGTFTALESLALHDGDNIPVIPKGSFRNTPNIRTLDITHCDIQLIHVDAFQGLGELEVLDLNSNAIQTLPEGVFSYSPKLMKIVIGGNRIKVLASNLFTGLIKLKEIWINYNQVQLVLNNGTFADLNNLTRLYLSRSRISSLPEDVFTRSEQLEYIDLDVNNLTHIPKGLFSGLRKLKHLDLEYNKIEKLDELLFHDLNGLKNLNLADNRIKNLPLALFDNVPNLQDLSLGNNGMTISASHNVYPATHAFLTNQRDKQFVSAEPEYSAMQNLRHLRHLYLNGNNISVMCIDWRSLHSLEWLELSNNSITFLSSKDMYFRSAPTVFLRENKIKYFDPYVYEGNRTTPTFNMDINPYNCCSLLPFVQKYSHKNVTNVPMLITEGATCATPADLRGKNLIDLTKDSLVNCSPAFNSLESRPSVVSVSSATSTFALCHLTNYIILLIIILVLKTYER